nr:hypothetical protein [Tanacetum cinerariifolium]
GKVKEIESRRILRGPVGIKTSRKSSIFPVCFMGRTIRLGKPAKLGEDYSQRLLIGELFGLELADDEALSLRRFRPAMAKDSFRCWRLAAFLHLCISLLGYSRVSSNFIMVLRVMEKDLNERKLEED